ncbi:MAG: hypothetical protein AUJ71_01265 [Candidatus Omnitrophica bacterium CG1_02_49_16]|nr:MAG: hypothetical protein AUJ71_01265 [Candidatus Omnitrophica bacterium CG1_02_49_16]
MAPKILNWEIVVYALHISGGGLRFIPTEDIAKKCFEAAPDLFSWVKYPEYPDKEVVRRALFHARDEVALVRGRAGKGKGHAAQSNADPALDGWSLTAEGAKWILEHKSRLEKILKFREPASHRQELLQKLDRIRRHLLFQHFLEQPEGFVPSLGEMAELFRCRVDSELGTWEKRFEMVISQAQMIQDSKILEFVDRCRVAVKNQSKEH